MRQAVVQAATMSPLVKGLQPVIRGHWNINNRDNAVWNQATAQTGGSTSIVETKKRTQCVVQLYNKRKCQLWPGEQDNVERRFGRVFCLPEFRRNSSPAGKFS